MNKKLKEEVWEKEEYWDLAERGSLNIAHPGMRLLFSIARGRNNILDIGCGEGTRLSLVDVKGKRLTGIDISSYAIKKAKVKYPNINFVSGNVESLPFPDKYFDLVYSAFVFEHLDRPERVISEAVRVLKVGGNLLIIAPNYGAPNRASPPFNGSRLKKLVTGFICDIFGYGVKGLHWRKVKPIANADIYKMDWDTTIEPYLGSLAPFVKELGLRIVKKMSCWGEEEDGAGISQRMFRIFSELGLCPFTNWGPHLVLLAEK